MKSISGAYAALAGVLVDILPPAWRKRLYSLCALAGVLIPLLAAAGTDIPKGSEVLAVVSVLVAALAASNTTVEAEAEAEFAE